MKRFMLRVAYDGTDYCGWQLQPEAPTVEGVLNRTISSLTGEEIKVIGASRTDSGVHALGNVAVFDSDTPIPAERLMFALNTKLPEDVRIVASCQVPADFHPRHCDTIKTYEYTIDNARVPSPLKRRYAHWVPVPLDVKAMNEGAQYIVGVHDFKAFCAAGSCVETTARNVTGIEVEEKDQLVTIRVKGEGFLYNMVRIIAGTLIKVGHGEYEPGHVADIIASMDRTRAGETAPAKGLCLCNIEYL